MRFSLGSEPVNRSAWKPAHVLPDGLAAQRPAAPYEACKHEGVRGSRPHDAAEELGVVAEPLCPTGARCIDVARSERVRVEIEGRACIVVAGDNTSSVERLAPRVRRLQVKARIKGSATARFEFVGPHERPTRVHGEPIGFKVSVRDSSHLRRPMAGTDREKPPARGAPGLRRSALEERELSENLRERFLCRFGVDGVQRRPADEEQIH